MARYYYIFTVIISVLLLIGPLLLADIVKPEAVELSIDEPSSYETIPDRIVVEQSNKDFNTSSIQFLYDDQSTVTHIEPIDVDGDGDDEFIAMGHLRNASGVTVGSFWLYKWDSSSWNEISSFSLNNFANSTEFHHLVIYDIEVGVFQLFVTGKNGNSPMLAVLEFGTTFSLKGIFSLTAGDIKTVTGIVHSHTSPESVNLVILANTNTNNQQTIQGISYYEGNNSVKLINSLQWIGGSTVGITCFDLPQSHESLCIITGRNFTTSLQVYGFGIKVSNNSDMDMEVVTSISYSPEEFNYYALSQIGRVSSDNQDIEFYSLGYRYTIPSSFQQACIAKFTLSLNDPEFVFNNIESYGSTDFEIFSYSAGSFVDLEGDNNPEIMCINVDASPTTPNSYVYIIDLEEDFEIQYLESFELKKERIKFNTVTCAEIRNSMQTSSKILLAGQQTVNEVGVIETFSFLKWSIKVLDREGEVFRNREFQYDIIVEDWHNRSVPGANISLLQMEGIETSILDIKTTTGTERILSLDGIVPLDTHPNSQLRLKLIFEKEDDIYTQFTFEKVLLDPIFPSLKIIFPGDHININSNPESRIEVQIFNLLPYAMNITVEVEGPISFISSDSSRLHGNSSSSSFFFFMDAEQEGTEFIIVYWDRDFIDNTQPLILNFSTQIGTYSKEFIVHLASDDIHPSTGDFYALFWCILLGELMAIVIFLIIAYSSTKRDLIEYVNMYDDYSLKELKENICFPWMLSIVVPSILSSYRKQGKFEEGLQLAKVINHSEWFNRLELTKYLVEARNALQTGNFESGYEPFVKIREILVNSGRYYDRKTIERFLEPITILKKSPKKQWLEKAILAVEAYRIAEQNPFKGFIMNEIVLNFPMDLLAENVAEYFKMAGDTASATEYLRKAYEWTIASNKSYYVDKISKLVEVIVPTTAVVSDEPTIPTVPPKSKTTCFHCGVIRPNAKDPCECGKPAVTCSVCLLQISHGTTVAMCPHCNHYAHDEHLREWIKIRGACPVCKKDLNSDEINSKLE